MSQPVIGLETNLVSSKWRIRHVKASCDLLASLGEGDDNRRARLVISHLNIQVGHRELVLHARDDEVVRLQVKDSVQSYYLSVPHELVLSGLDWDLPRAIYFLCEPEQDEAIREGFHLIRLFRAQRDQASILGLG